LPSALLPLARRLPRLSCMSAVELAVKKVKRLSDQQARELLDWLGKQPPVPARRKARQTRRRTAKRYPTTKELLAWYDSIRLTTEWAPPRMPDDLVKPVEL